MNAADRALIAAASEAVETEEECWEDADSIRRCLGPALAHRRELLRIVKELEAEAGSS